MNLCRRRTRPARGALLRIPVLVGLLAAPLHLARAHEGPPFPILVDQPVGPYLVSVWTDPDIGTGTFYVVLEPGPGGEMADVDSVVVAVRPASGRLAEARYPAAPQRVRYGARYYTEVAFDRGEPWRVRVRIAGPAGGGELVSEVVPTPDGTIGPAGLVVYLLPFLAVGLLWLKAMLRRRSTRPEEPGRRDKAG